MRLYKVNSQIKTSNNMYILRNSRKYLSQNKALPNHVANEKRSMNVEAHYWDHVQPGDLVNTKSLFFLDIGRMPAASQDSIQFHMVSYCSAIKTYDETKVSFSMECI